MTADLELIRLWDSGAHSAMEIAALFTAAGVPTTKNSVLGRVFRLRKAGRIARPVREYAEPHPRPKPPRARPDELGPHGCRFIAGEPDGVWTVWCDKPPLDLSPYCPEHHARCRVPYTLPTRPADIKRMGTRA